MRTRLPCMAVSLVCLACSGSSAGSDVKGKDIIIIGPKDTSEVKDKGLDTNLIITDSGISCSDGTCPPGEPVCAQPQGVCVQCIVNAHCKDANTVCVDNKCLPRVCEPLARSCDGTVAVSCDATGAFQDKVDCKTLGFPCVDGECGKCTPGQKTCAGNQKKLCNEKGSDFTLTDCGDGFCLDGECVLCVPDLVTCQGDDVVKCGPTGTEFTVLTACDPNVTGLVCKDGECGSLCEVTERTNAGCEYWPLDLDQNFEFEAENQQFAVIVSNASQYDAHVTVLKGADIEAEAVVKKNDLAIIPLAPFNISEPGKGLFGRRLKSTVPIVAYQFNPLENVGVFSNDASLLLPTNVLGKEYRVMAWKSRDQTLSSYFTLVAAEEGQTQVKFTVTAATQAGEGLPALNAGETGTVGLQQFETLHVKTSQACTDLTGTLIQSDKKVAVMGGHECANIPAGGNCGGTFCCCDHLEDQLFPIEAWGKHYVLGRTWPRGKAPDTVRVLVAEDGTTVTVDGAAVTVPMLSAGQYHEFEVDTHIDVTADKPILAAQYLESQTSPTGCNETCDDMLFTKKCDGNPFGKNCNTDEDCCPGVAGIGDPALIIAVPVEQFRQSYIFLVPNKYAMDYVNIIAPMGAEVQLDSVPIPPGDFEPIAGGPFAVARKPVADGVHRITSAQDVNVVVYGWDQYVSYGYAGGMNVDLINIE